LVFSSAVFLFVFLPAVYAAALATRRHIAVQNALLALVSVAFYAWGEPAFAVLMLLSVFANYCFALLIGRARRGGQAARGEQDMAGDRARPNGRAALADQDARSDQPQPGAQAQPYGQVAPNGLVGRRDQDMPGGQAQSDGQTQAGGQEQLGGYAQPGVQARALGQPPADGAAAQGGHARAVGQTAAPDQAQPGDQPQPGDQAAQNAQTRPRAGKAALLAAVLFNVGLLCVFKYADFAIETANSLLGASIPLPRLPLPVGISFFTFQAMSYAIDVYRGDAAPQRNFVRLLLYISFFPQLIAGPIVRYGDIERALSERAMTLEDTAYGIRRFIFGLSKKLLIANTLGGIADSVYAAVGGAAAGGTPGSLGALGALGAPAAWLGAIAYALQIYYDFSGYSDMAIGLGRAMGFRFQENFRYPYAATSVRDFWKRWHISLSTWFKEYVYIPLGGSRGGRLRTGLNKLAVFLMTGLWHGADWTFVAWGLFHGIFILLETYGAIKPGRLPRPAARVYALLVAVVGFAIFRADTMGQAAAMLSAMFPFFGAAPAQAPSRWLESLLPLLKPTNALALAAALALAGAAAQRVRERARAEAPAFALSAALLLACLMNLASSAYNPFIYFRF
jgi:alginate O-acetyltransferase complex protein AlgI